MSLTDDEKRTVAAYDAQATRWASEHQTSGFWGKEMEVRELLTKYGYPGDKTPIIRGSALKATEGDAKYEEKILRIDGLT